MNYTVVNFSTVQTLALVGIALLSLSIARTQTVSPRNIGKLEKSAATPQEFAQLATYFAHQAALFHENAAEESAVLQEEQEHASAASKYPHTSDRARMLRDYYQRRAEDAHHKEQVYASRRGQTQMLRNDRFVAAPSKYAIYLSHLKNHPHQGNPGKTTK